MTKVYLGFRAEWKSGGKRQEAVQTVVLVYRSAGRWCSRVCVHLKADTAIFISIGLDRKNTNTGGL